MTASSLLRLLSLFIVAVAAACASSGKNGQPADQAQVTAADIEENPDMPIEQLIQRKVPGVSVYKNADGRIALYLRGAVSIDADHPKPPMYVVNDLPMQAGSDGEIPVNPYDIATIKVLKGADAGIYGVEGANGVIVITTKQGKTRNVKP